MPGEMLVLMEKGWERIAPTSDGHILSIVAGVPQFVSDPARDVAAKLNHMGAPLADTEPQTIAIATAQSQALGAAADGLSTQLAFDSIVAELNALKATLRACGVIA